MTTNRNLLPIFMAKDGKGDPELANWLLDRSVAGRREEIRSHPSTPISRSPDGFRLVAVKPQWVSGSAGSGRHPTRKIRPHPFCRSPARFRSSMYPLSPGQGSGGYFVER